MTPTQFRTLGELLRGPAWQRALACDLAANERTIRRYASGESPIPAHVARQVVGLLYAHAANLERMARAVPLS